MVYCLYSTDESEGVIFFHLQGVFSSKDNKSIPDSSVVTTRRYVCGEYRKMFDGDVYHYYKLPEYIIEETVQNKYLDY